MSEKIGRNQITCKTGRNKNSQKNNLPVLQARNQRAVGHELSLSVNPWWVAYVVMIFDIGRNNFPYFLASWETRGSWISGVIQFTEAATLYAWSRYAQCLEKQGITLSSTLVHSSPVMHLTAKTTFRYIFPTYSQGYSRPLGCISNVRHGG